MQIHAMHILNAFLMVLVLVPGLQKIAGRVGLLDHPHGRKLHEGSVPLTGGIAMFGAFLLPLMFFDAKPNWAFLLGLTGLVLLGASDDALDLKPVTKLLGQILAVGLMILPEGNLLSFQDFPAEIAPFLEPLSVPLTVLFIVGVINAVNMIDGLDGLAGCMAASAIAFLVLSAALTGQNAAASQLVLLLAAVLGFLMFNMRHPWRSRAAIFMGDSGSLMLGAAIASYAVSLSSSPAEHVPFTVAIWFSIVPILDMVLLIVRRLASRQSPLVGDRRHLHHLLLETGIPPITATLLLLGMSVVWGAVGLAGWSLGLPGPTMLYLLVAPFAAHAGLVAFLSLRAGHRRTTTVTAIPLRVEPEIITLRAAE